MLEELLVERKLEQQRLLAHGTAKPTQFGLLLAQHEPEVSGHEFHLAIEPQVIWPAMPLEVGRKTVMPPKRTLESGLGLAAPMESDRWAQVFPKNAPSEGLFGRLGFEFGPTVELAYAKQLLEHEQVTDARAFLERAIRKYPEDERLRKLHRAIAPGRVERRVTHYPDRTIEATWIQAHRVQYRGKWVALLGEQVLGIGDDLQTVLRLVREHQLDEPPLIHHFAD